VTFPEHIAILGPGLLGGSLAMAVRKHFPESRITLWARREEAVEKIREMQIADIASTNVREVVSGADLIILATPITVMESLAREIVKADLSDGAIITDVGSVKASVVSELEPVCQAAGKTFLGSHPMAGSERTGIEAARADLFDGAACILTPTARTSRDDVARLTGFWRALGCRVLEMDAQEHDRRIARISHLPHVMAAATTLAALRASPAALDCAGNGFRDSTRVAAGDADLWTGILAGNRAEVLAAVRDASDTLREFLEMLDGLDEEALRRFLLEAKSLRDRLPAGRTRHGDD
jgi:prephenate dehydrogenase